MVDTKRRGASRARARVRVKAQRPRRPRVPRLRTTAGRSPSGRVVVRPFFLGRATQQMSSIPTAQEWIGGVIMLAAIASWGLLAALLIG